MFFPQCVISDGPLRSALFAISVLYLVCGLQISFQRMAIVRQSKRFFRFCASDPRNFDFVFSLVPQQVRSLGMLLIDGLLSVHADRCCFLQPSTMEILVESAFAHAPSRSFLKYFCGFSFKCDV